jgi:hypothetical protein
MHTPASFRPLGPQGFTWEWRGSFFSILFERVLALGRSPCRKHPSKYMLVPITPKEAFVNLERASKQCVVVVGPTR